MEDCPFQLTKSEPACLPIKGDMAAFAGGQAASPRSILLGDAVRIFGYGNWGYKPLSLEQMVI